MRTFATLAEFAAAQGGQLGYSPWREVTQAHVDMYADATGDRQWIHSGPVPAAGSRPGSTVARGYLALALVPVFMSEIFRIEDLTMSINIGLNQARFPAPVRAGPQAGNRGVTS